jgi:hypothetical protein
VLSASVSVQLGCSPTGATSCMKMVACDLPFFLLATVPSLFIRPLSLTRLKLQFRRPSRSQLRAIGRAGFLATSVAQSHSNSEVVTTEALQWRKTILCTT